MFEWISSPEAWIALFTLTVLEIILGIDNIIFISILVGRLPKHQRRFGRIVGLSLAMIMRILLLFSIAFIMRLTTPLITIMTLSFSGRDLILLFGGLFLVVKSIIELKHSMHPAKNHKTGESKYSSLMGTLVQITLLDMVFSLDSVITAVGMANDIEVMVIAIIVAVAVMMLAAKSISDFVDNYPTLKTLALVFLVLIGIALILESFTVHVPKAYIYFSIAFSVVVEILNIRIRHNQQKLLTEVK